MSEKKYIRRYTEEQFAELLRRYARLIVRLGVNVQPGQTVKLSISTELGDLAALIAEEAYRAGAQEVTADWHNQALTKLAYQYESVETLGTMKKWKEEKLACESETLPAQIHITSEDPKGLKDVDPAKMSAVQRRLYPIVKPYRDKMENKYQWVIAGAAAPDWARAVFPEYTEEDAVRALWEAIFQTARVNLDEDPLSGWERHNESFRRHTEWLNGQNFKKLHYHASNGTNFSVPLNPHLIWAGGGEDTEGSKIFFQPNIPTEEVFTTPLPEGAEGVVVASKPLSYKGQLIENFRIEFAGGKAVRWSAERGEELLTEMLNMDEGAGRLGEVALVPFDSPINQTGLLFQNTLYDENACCHLAVGRGFTMLVKDYEKYTLEEIMALGINESMIHVDFMIGTPDLSIDGEKEDGSLVPVFRHGTWAID